MPEMSAIAAMELMQAMHESSAGAVRMDAAEAPQDERVFAYPQTPEPQRSPGKPLERSA